MLQQSRPTSLQVLNSLPRSCKCVCDLDCVAGSKSEGSKKTLT